MAANLPSTVSLRMFEATARNLSFTRAANELHVTQAAVSRQIRSLESLLGATLIERGSRSIQLTAAGQQYFVAVRDILENLAQATREVSSTDLGPFTVTASLAFTSTWLVPRLSSFERRHPDVDLRLVATDEVLDLRRERIDLAIRNGYSSWPGCHVESLFSRSLFPVCHPDLLDDRDAPSSPAHLMDLPLINLEGTEGTLWHWHAWLAAMGVYGSYPRFRLSFNRYELAVDAALNGSGVILAGSDTVDVHLRSGNLVQPLPGCALETEGNQLVWLPNDNPHPAFERFTGWLHEQARYLDRRSQDESNGVP